MVDINAIWPVSRDLYNQVLAKLERYDNPRLSRMLFEARDNLEMFADIAEAELSQPADYLRNLIKEIDDYRAAQGWSPDGFGGE
jgi:hypothetical protein